MIKGSKKEIGYDPPQLNKYLDDLVYGHIFTILIQNIIEYLYYKVYSFHFWVFISMVGVRPHDYPKTLLVVNYIIPGHTNIPA